MILYDMIWYDMIWYDMIWYDMIWYDMIWYLIYHGHRIILDQLKIVFSYSWLQIFEDVPISLSDNIQDKTNDDGCTDYAKVSQNNHNLIVNWNMIWLWYDMIWYVMIWYDMIWYDYNIIWYDMIWYDMIWYDMICDRSCS